MIKQNSNGLDCGRWLTFIFIISIDKWVLIQEASQKRSKFDFNSHSTGKGHLANGFWRKKNEEEKVKMEGSYKEIKLTTIHLTCETFYGQ